MPVQKVNQPVNTFVKGLITEVSPLNYPEGASLDEVNFKLNRDGSRDKRWGMQHIYREALPYTRIELEKMYGKAYKWEQPKGSRRAVIGVIQIGTLLYFIDLTIQPQITSISETLTWYDTPIPLLNGGVAFDASDSITGGTPVEFATLNGYLLLLSSEVAQPYLAWYNEDEDVVQFATAALLVRDIWGVDDGLADDHRPTDLSELHRYNLLNQGWSSDIITTCGTNVIDCFRTTFNAYPSNSDAWAFGRIADLTAPDVFKFDPAQAQKNSINLQPAAKGKYIISVYDRGVSRNAQTLITIPTDREETYCSTIETFAGRAWYSGVRGKLLEGDNKSPNYNNAVFFSQVMESPIDLIKCYQEADPTSVEFNELVDTDGGVIFIPECSFVRKLKAIKTSIWVFGDNGVWEIRGTPSTGFTATSFEVVKVNSIGLSAKDSVVDANGTLLYWGYSGIYAIVPDENVNGLYNTVSITQSTIQTKYNDLDTYAKTSAKGIYDPYNNKARWLFNDYTLGKEITDYQVGECNYQPFLVGVSGLATDEWDNVILFTHKDGVSPDSTLTYAYVFAINKNNSDQATMDSNGLLTQLTNGKILSYTTITPPTGDLWSHIAFPISVGYQDPRTDLYYFYVRGPTTTLVAKKIRYDASSRSFSELIGETSIINNCRNTTALLSIGKTTSTQFIIAYHNNNLKASVKLVNTDFTYGATLDSANTVNATYSTDQYINVSVYSSSSAALVYQDSVNNKCTIDYLTISGNTVSRASSTVFPNTTQLPTGTSTFTKCVGFRDDSVLTTSKLFVCGLLTNSTLGYTNVLSCFIVSKSGSVLSSSTILNIPTETGTSDTQIKVVYTRGNMASTYITIVYDTIDTNYTRVLRYVLVDVANGVTPVYVSSGIWVDSGDLASYTPYNIHYGMGDTDGYLYTAYRGTNSSLGLGGVNLKVDKIL
jgi:hypothetical protein